VAVLPQSPTDKIDHAGVFVGNDDMRPVNAAGSHLEIVSLGTRNVSPDTA
jgi:hypothetical protein